MGDSDWLICPRPNPRASVRLLCLPYAGGGASAFRAWAEEAPDDLEVAAVQLPGRESRWKQKPFTSLETLIPVLADALLPGLRPPFALLGHSMGALIGFELARELRRSGRPLPCHFFVLGRPAPQIPAPAAPIHDLPDSEFIDSLRRLNGTPAEILADEALMRVFLPVLRADFALVETHRNVEQPPLPCPISAFGGLGDGEVSREDLMAWRSQTTGRFFSRFYTGGHFFLHEHRSALLGAIRQDLLESVRLQPV